MKSSVLKRAGLACGIAAACVVGAKAPQAAKSQDTNSPPEIDTKTLLHAAENPNDWVMYHQSYKSHHYSALDQINTSNVKNLQIAWMHTPNGAKRGCNRSLSS
jgi:alcohol dehydrogenase (cytochrome c)